MRLTTTPSPLVQEARRAQALESARPALLGLDARLLFRKECRCGRCRGGHQGGWRHGPPWPKPQVRPIRFHDLRHTTATLLQAGVPLASVQKFLQHRDPLITVEVYGHLTPDYLRTEVDPLSFGLRPAQRQDDSGG